MKERNLSSFSLFGYLCDKNVGKEAVFNVDCLLGTKKPFDGTLFGYILVTALLSIVNCDKRFTRTFEMELSPVAV